MNIKQLNIFCTLIAVYRIQLNKNLLKIDIPLSWTSQGHIGDTVLSPLRECSTTAASMFAAESSLLCLCISWRRSFLSAASFLRSRWRSLLLSRMTWSRWVKALDRTVCQAKNTLHLKSESEAAVTDECNNDNLDNNQLQSNRRECNDWAVIGIIASTLCTNSMYLFVCSWYSSNTILTVQVLLPLPHTEVEPLNGPLKPCVCGALQVRCISCLCRNNSKIHNKTTQQFRCLNSCYT